MRKRWMLVPLMACSLTVFAADKKNDVKAMDKNGDGAVSREEWTGKAKKFEKLDVNSDGKIAKDDKKSAEERLRGMDANNDGVIARSEWKGNAKLFDRMDSNKDGQLAASEMQRRQRRK